MNTDDFQYLHRILASYYSLSKLYIEEYKEDYIANFKLLPSYIFCTKRCAENFQSKNKIVELDYILELSRTKSIMPIDNLFLMCGECNYTIGSNSNFYILSSRKVNDLQYLYESIFSKYFLTSLITNTIHRFFTYGMLFKNDIYSETAFIWLSTILKQNITEIKPDTVFYRAKKQLYSNNRNYDLKNKELMRLPDVEYLSDNRFTRSGVANLYLGEDIETCKKEIRYEGGQYYTAKFVIKEKIKVLDLSNINNIEVIDKLIKDSYESYKISYDECIQIFILIESAYNCIKNFFVPHLSKEADDSHNLKPEYIISQLLADISKLLFVNGILYNSTKQMDKKCLCFYNVNDTDKFFEQEDTIKHIM